VQQKKDIKIRDDMGGFGNNQWTARHLVLPYIPYLRKPWSNWLITTQHVMNITYCC